MFQCRNCRSNISDTTELRGEAAELGAYIVDGADSLTGVIHIPACNAIS